MNLVCLCEVEVPKGSADVKASSITLSPELPKQAEQSNLPPWSLNHHSLADLWIQEVVAVVVVSEECEHGDVRVTRASQTSLWRKGGAAMLTSHRRSVVTPSLWSYCTCRITTMPVVVDEMMVRREGGGRW